MRSNHCHGNKKPRAHTRSDWPYLNRRIERGANGRLAAHRLLDMVKQNDLIATRVHILAGRHLCRAHTHTRAILSKTMPPFDENPTSHKCAVAVTSTTTPPRTQTPHESNPNQFKSLSAAANRSAVRRSECTTPRGGGGGQRRWRGGRRRRPKRVGRSHLSKLGDEHLVRIAGRFHDQHLRDDQIRRVNMVNIE